MLSHSITRVVMLAACGFACLCTKPCAASITPPAALVLQRYIEATGGEAALDAERSFHLQGRLSSAGLTGNYEAWIQTPDRMVEIVSLGSLQQRTGVNGNRGWRTDLRLQHLQMLDGKDLEERQAEVWFQTEQWLGPEQGDGAVVMGSKTYGADVTYDVLEITPPRGPGRRLWFSTRTGLLTRMVVKGDLRSTQRFFSGYRAISSRLRATLIGESAAGEGSDQPDGLTLNALEVNTAIDSSLFEPPVARESPITWLGARSMARLPFRYGTRHVWLRASINGAPPADFLLDTGASVTALDQAYAKQLGLHAEGHVSVDGMGESGDAQFALVNSIRLAGAGGDGVEVSDFKVSVLDLNSALEPVMWRTVAGRLGQDFISRFVAEIDYDSLRLTLRDPSGFTYAGRGTAIPMGLADNCPTIHLELDNGCEGEFLVDVGNSFNLNIRGSMVRRCHLFQPARKEVEVWGGGFGGSFSASVCRLQRIRIGPYDWDDPIAALSLGSRGVAGSKDFSGNIGNGILERFKCTFDYRHHVLYLEPGRRFGEREHFSRSGTVFVRNGDHIMTVGVTPRSGAEEAGLHAADEVVAIDGRPILRYTPEEIDRLLDNGPSGSTHEIAVRRQGGQKTLTLTLKLRDIL